MLSPLLRYRRRAARVDPQAARLARPVISIGNISMGGRGKTPLAGLVARLLVEAGERPAILSRGYGRTIADAGVTIVSDGHVGADGRTDTSRLADLAHSGDEPLMLARMVPGAAVLVCEQRALAGMLAETALGCTVHILDDGFQHHVLQRDVDIVLLAAADFTDRVVPFGRLREPLDALSDADAIVIDGGCGTGATKDTCASVLATLKPRPVFTLQRQLGAPTETLAPGARVVAVAGIATPQRFFDALTAQGWAVAETLPFKDHHVFSDSDARSISAAASRSGAAAVVATSKDMVKLSTLGPWPVPLIEIPLEVSVTPADKFREWLLQTLAAARAGKAPM